MSLLQDHGDWLDQHNLDPTLQLLERENRSKFPGPIPKTPLCEADVNPRNHYGVIKSDHRPMCWFPVVEGEMFCRIHLRQRQAAAAQSHVHKVKRKYTHERKSNGEN